MSTIINADTSDGLKFTSDTSGEIKLQSAGTDIATVSSTGITMASGKLLAPTGPAFSAYQSSGQSISHNTVTKVQFQTEEFDTNSNYDNATNYRFTPTVAGYYQVNSAVFFNLGVTALNGICSIYKNGSAFKTINGFGDDAGGWFNPMITALVYLDGSTDYVEIYISQLSGTSQNIATGANTYFQASLVRAA